MASNFKHNNIKAYFDSIIVEHDTCNQLAGAGGGAMVDDEALVTTIQNGVARDARYAVVISIQRQLPVPPSLEQLKTAVKRQWSTIEDEKTAKKLEEHSLDHAKCVYPGCGS
eukprot:517732-Rhodomonas_salina.1